MPRANKVSLTSTLLLLAAAGAAQADLGAPTSSAACCQLTTSLAASALRGRDLPGDKRFLVNESAPPNLHFLVDTSYSMLELPQVQGSDHAAFFAQGEGCSHRELLAEQANRRWNPSTPVPPPDPDHPRLFEDSRYYAYHGWEASPDAPPSPWATPEEACTAQHPATEDPGRTRYGECLSCLRSRGFYLRPGTAPPGPDDDPQRGSFVLWGRFLNFNPPKYVTARAVLKSVLRELQRVRVGLSTFDTQNGAELVLRQRPSCNELRDNPLAFQSHRERFLSAVDSLQFDDSTPLAESLLNIGQYFSSSNQVYESAFGFPARFLKPSFANASLESPERSWCWACQATSVIIITDGEPASDQSVPAERLHALNGGSVGCPASAPCLDDDNHKLDDLAHLLATQDLVRNTPEVVGELDTAGRQSLTLYGIGFGRNIHILQNAAQVGGGQYYHASNAEALTQALRSIVSTVQQRAGSFTAATLPGLQVQGEAGTLVPRLRPGRTIDQPWQGALYRFNLASELLLGCDPARARAGAGDPQDLNGDRDCEDVHLVDADGDAVREDAEGHFVKYRDSRVPARPHWEAGRQLKPPGPTQRWRTRTLYTLVDNGGPAGAPDNRLDRHDTPIAFEEAQASVLQQYLGIGPGGCPELAARLGDRSLRDPVHCAKAVIRYWRGADVLNPDPTLREQDREFLLHDIFHSAPQEVVPPMPKDFCAFSRQCLETLFAGKTELQQGYAAPGGGRRDAYEEYVAQRGQRDKVVLVGSNGGMLHAFHSGSYQRRDSALGLVEHDVGTGEELWGFVPPDLLPRLLSSMGRHTALADGTAMVREVWLDGVGEGAVADGRKQAGEFRTVAIVGTGAGGVHRVALDLTGLLPDSSARRAGRPPSQPGDVLWVWPQPCEGLALQLGESEGHFAPRPPPVGPVALEDPSGPWNINNTRAREQWVAFFNGGYDPAASRGRGLAMVDVATGETLWSFFHGDGSARSEHLRYPFAASAAMMDLPGEGQSEGDLLFDTATVADMGGQVWVVRFWQPGHRPGAGQRVDNWFAARALKASGESPGSLSPPFTYMTSNTLQPDTGYLRTFVGTGDRYNLADGQGTTCRLSNPLACAQLGCQVSRTVAVREGGQLVWNASVAYAGGRYRAGRTEGRERTQACLGSQVSLEWEQVAAEGCMASTAGRLEQTCGGAEWSCAVTRDDWRALEVTKPLPAQSPHLFYGVWSFGGSLTRIFNTDSEASAFEAPGRLLTEAELVDVSQFDREGRVVRGARESGALEAGWYLRYGSVREQTASGAAVVRGCVVWNGFEPAAPGGVCRAGGRHVARLYQASFVGGTADCVEGMQVALPGGGQQWQRYTERTVVAVPAEPVPQRTPRAVGLVLHEAGRLQRIGVSLDEEALQSLYQLELDRTAHTCRHESTGCE